MTDTPKPLTFSRSPKLDATLASGWEAWLAAARAAGVPTTAKWLADRAGDPDLLESATEFLAPLADPDGDREERVEGLMSLAEVAEEIEDPLLAEALWEGVLTEGKTGGDPDVVAEASARLAGLAEEMGDLLAAAESWVDFLNWRRAPGNSSDPEQVENAFDELARLADLDGARGAAATWRYRQAQFTRLWEAEDERTVDGDWTDGAGAWSGWE